MELVPKVPKCRNAEMPKRDKYFFIIYISPTTHYMGVILNIYYIAVILYILSPS